MALRIFISQQNVKTTDEWRFGGGWIFSCDGSNCIRFAFLLAYSDSSHGIPFMEQVIDRHGGTAKQETRVLEA